MPAITADTLTLARVSAPDPADTERPVRSITTGPRGYEGEGFPVVRAFAGVSTAALDPFVHMDQMGEVEYQPGEPRGTDWHPHRGFETVTYMIDGAFEHEDSTGGGGLITDGATQWMTAGSGILHSELPPQEMVARGGLFHGVQLWVNLPAAQKWAAPAYQDITGADVTLVSSDDGGALVRLIAGQLGGYAGPGVTQTPIVYAHATFAPGASLATGWPADFNALVYVLGGRGYAGTEQRPLAEGQLAVFGPGDALAVRAADAMDVLLLGGLPIREPVARYGPFVMNTRQEIIQAVEDYQHGRLGTIPPASRHLRRMAHRSEADETLG